ncbi:MAG: TonB-dependent siderophore receptor [Steroidobacteraceae bacterium]
MKNRANPGAWLALLSTSALIPAAWADDPAQPATSTQNGPQQRVVITASPEKENYRAASLDSLGPLGTTPLIDTPYSVGVLTSDMIENSQAVNFKDISKYLPLVQYQEQQGPDILRPQTRGMEGGNFQNTRLDGMQMYITVATAMEQFQQIEAVNGLSASLYGPANPSGMFNFISKRPTDQPQLEVWTTYNSDGIGTAKVDMGGPIDSNGVVSYRLNALYGAGDGWVDRSHERRALGDLAVDVRPWERGVLELNYSSYSLDTFGYPGWFTYGKKITLPPAPDPTRLGYGQEYAGVDMTTHIATARFKQDLGSGWRLVAGVLSQDASRDINTAVNNLTNNAGDYTSSFANGFAPRFVMTSDTAYLNDTFDAWGIGNDLTLGTAGYKSRSFSTLTKATAGSVLLGKASIPDPMIFPEPAAGPPDTLANYDSSDAYQQGMNIGDTLRFNRYWLARLGVSQDWFETINHSTKRVQTSEYSDHGLSPTGSIMFKPEQNQTAYFTYASSLQAGDLAPGTAANAGQSLAPYRSTEYEVGYKASLSGIDLTAAVFRIRRPFANINPVDNVFEISGDQDNGGVEFSAVGQLVDGLTIYGGLTLLDARMQHTPLVSTDDKLYVGAPKQKGNVLLEYQIPNVPGLVASFDYQFSGERAGNDTNAFMVTGYNLFDVGVRYAVNRVTLRLAVDNLANRAYWSTIAPSDLTGTNTGSLIAYLGSPRTVLASVTVAL